MSILTDTAPKRIYLCVSDDADDYDLPYPEVYGEDEAITWSTDSPVACTVEYVRADLHSALVDKALRFDLNQAGIERREQEATELVETRSQRDILRQHLHDEHQRHVGTMGERDKMEKERDIALADLASLRTAFEDWKVFHSTSRLEAEHAAEMYKLRQECDDWFSRCTEAQASVAIAREERDNAENERDDAIRTAQDNAAQVEKLEDDLAIARDGWHMANGTADLAMKHRDKAEADIAAAREVLLAPPIGYISKNTLNNLTDPQWQELRNTPADLWTVDQPPSRAVIPVYVAPQQNAAMVKDFMAERDALQTRVAELEAENKQRSMNPLERELATMRKFSACRSDDECLDEADAELARLRKIESAARTLVDNAEEYECDGLGLWAQHGWWEPLHDALDFNGSASADDIRHRAGIMRAVCT